MSSSQPPTQQPAADENLLGDTNAAFAMRTLLDPVLIALTLLTIPLAVWGALRTAADPNDHGALTSFLLTMTPIIPAAWSVLRVIWSEDPKFAILIALVRTVLTPVVVAWPPAIAVAVTVHLPSVRARIEATQSDGGWRYYFGERDGSLLHQGLLLTGLVGLIFAMLSALVLCVFVVLPVLAWSKPIGTAQSNMLLVETPEDRAAAKVGIRLLSILLMMIFAVPTLIIWGKGEAVSRSWIEAFTNLPLALTEPSRYWGDLMWVIGILLIPAGISLMLWVLRVQRPDVAKRAQFGVNARGDEPGGNSNTP